MPIRSRVPCLENGRNHTRGEAGSTLVGLCPSCKRGDWRLTSLSTGVTIVITVLYPHDHRRVLPGGGQEFYSCPRVQAFQ